MWIDDRDGGYDYAIQNVKTGLYCAKSGRATAKYDDILLAEDMEESDLNVVEMFRGHLDTDALDAVEREDYWQESEAYEFGKRFVLPGFRLVRIPFFNWNMDDDDQFYDEDGDFDYVAIRDFVFGKDQAIAMPGEVVPDDAPWSACDGDTLLDRLAIPNYGDQIDYVAVLNHTNEQINQALKEASERDGITNPFEWDSRYPDIVERVLAEENAKLQERIALGNARMSQERRSRGTRR